MLGERRSKAAFSAGFPEAVREETRQDSGHLPEEIMETEASLDGLDGGRRQKKTSKMIACRNRLVKDRCMERRISGQKRRT
ncbi:MAG: hypothetical protein ACLTBC_17240 [Pilosibacter sp.]